MLYDDFVVQIGAIDGDGYRVRVLTSPAGEGTGRFTPPGARLRMAASGLPERRGPAPTDDSVARTPDSAEGWGEWATRDIQMAEEEGEALDPRQMGEQLYTSLFSGRVGALYERSLGALGGDPERGLRLKIKLDPTVDGFLGLESLPWELLLRGDTGEFLGLDRRSPVVRYLDVPQPARPIPLPRRLATRTG